MGEVQGAPVDVNVTARETVAEVRNRLGAAANGFLGRCGLRIVAVAKPPRKDGAATRRSRSPWPSGPIGDGRVLLRELTVHDIPDLVAACADPELVYRAGWPTPFSETEAHRWLRGEAVRHAAGEALDLAIVDTESGAFAGFVQLHQVDWLGGRASIGLWLARPGRGQGLMSRSLTLFVGWVFRETSLHRLEFLTLAENTPALALAERCGFRREGLLRDRLVRNGRAHDGVLYAAVRSDWSA